MNRRIPYVKKRKEKKKEEIEKNRNSLSLVVRQSSLRFRACDSLSAASALDLLILETIDLFFFYSRRLRAFCVNLEILSLVL